MRFLGRTVLSARQRTLSLSMEYRVEVVRSGEWWAITVPSLRGAFSQAKLLDEVPAAAREAIAMMLDVDPADVGAIDVHVREQGEAGSLA